MPLTEMKLIVITILFKILGIIIPLLISVAYFTIAERKIMGAVQRRRGPNVIGIFGLLQPLADGLKLFVKETNLPANADRTIFLLAPFLSFVLSLISWAVIPFEKSVVLCDLNLGVLYLFAVSGLNVYGILFAGWASNSKYAYLGALRSAAQMIGYEISMGFSILNVVLCAGSFNLSVIVLAQTKIWFVLPLLPIYIIFHISMLAETNRHPFDLPEAEAELVSGYNVEYSAMTFALFFLSEYANMLLMSAFGATLFLGGWLPPINAFGLDLLPGAFWLSFKICIGVIFFIVTRATLPRYRYDQLMYLGWRCFLPLSLGYFMFTAGILIGFNWLP
jgi:NADH-quinone oxidoreductase subunit H